MKLLVNLTILTNYLISIIQIFDHLIDTLQDLLSSVTSAHHSPSARWTVVNSGSAGPTDKMSLLTLEHLRLSCEPLVTNRTLGYSAGDVGGVGSAHQAQDVG